MRGLGGRRKYIGLELDQLDTVTIDRADPNTATVEINNASIRGLNKGRPAKIEFPSS